MWVVSSNIHQSDSIYRPIHEHHSHDVTLSSVQSLKKGRTCVLLFEGISTIRDNKRFLISYEELQHSTGSYIWIISYINSNTGDFKRNRIHCVSSGTKENSNTTEGADLANLPLEWAETCSCQRHIHSALDTSLLCMTLDDHFCRHIFRRLLLVNGEQLNWDLMSFPPTRFCWKKVFFFF